MKEKLFFIKIKHSPTIIRHILSRRWACPSNSMLIHQESCPFKQHTHRLAVRGPHFRSWPVNIFNLSLAINDSLVLSRNQSRHHYFCVRNLFSFVFIAFLYWTKMNFRLLEREVSLLSYAAWFLFIGYSWIGLLLSAIHSNNHGRRSCT